MDLSERKRSLVRRHPWEQARVNLLITLLRRAGATESRIDVLDVGAGDGWGAAQIRASLHPESAIVCWDTNYLAHDVVDLADNAPAGVSFTREEPIGAFDWLLLLDVIEHVEDDQRWLSQLVREHLRPGGYILATVPAWPRLYSRHDVALHHFRRYSPSQFRHLVAGAGIELLQDGGMFASLLVPRLLTVMRERIQGQLAQPIHQLSATNGTASSHGVGDWNRGPALTALIAGALRADARVAELVSRARVRPPGLSHWAVGRKT